MEIKEDILNLFEEVKSNEKFFQNNKQQQCYKYISASKLTHKENGIVWSNSIAWEMFRCRADESKEGCRVTPRQGKLLGKALRYCAENKWHLKTYTMPKRLILFSVK